MPCHDHAPANAAAARDRPPNLARHGFLQDPLLKRVLAALVAGGGEARVAGGVVRNALLGEPVADDVDVVDIATTELPERVIALAERAGFAVHPTGLSHGTVTVVASGDGRVRPFEVTTLRRDVETDGRHATVSFTEDWRADAERRDFTINALYCDAKGNVHDPLGAYGDLLDRRVRFVGDPHQRIREDYLRILRFFRFHARYGRGRLDRAGLAAATELKAGARELSGERIAAELKKLLLAAGVAAVVKPMARRSILAALLPGPFDVKSLERMVEIDATEGEAPDAMQRLAALTRASPDKLKESLKLSNAEWKRLVALDGSPDITPALSDQERRVALYRLGSTGFRDVVRLRWARSGAPADSTSWSALLQLAAQWAVPHFPVTGADLLAKGFAPGPAIGQTLRALEEWWCAHGFTPDKAAILEEVAALTGKDNDLG
jgi:poly(A) polymerase